MKKTILALLLIAVGCTSKPAEKLPDSIVLSPEQNAAQNVLNETKGMPSHDTNMTQMERDAFRDLRSGLDACSKDNAGKTIKLNSCNADLVKLQSDFAVVNSQYEELSAKHRWDTVTEFMVSLGATWIGRVQGFVFAIVLGIVLSFVAWLKNLGPFGA